MTASPEPPPFPPDEPRTDPVESAPPAPPPEPPRAPVAFEFTGTGSEYFRIWAINITLTVVTLGIYSAWAKVRREQYFARHTLLAGLPFDYHGPPVAILKGRLVAATLFAVYTVAGWISPTAVLASMAVVGLVMPWLLARSFRFRARNTSYRGIRFGFTGSVGQAYWVFAALPVLSVLSFLLVAPYWHRQMKDYLHDNAWYGQQRFTHHTPVPYFYATYAMAVLTTGVLIIGLIVVVTGVGLILTLNDPAPGTGPGLSNNPTLFLLSGAFFYVIGIVIVQTLVAVRLQNGVWRHTRLGDSRFIYRLEFPRLLAIRITNLLALIATVGLFRPVAQVRVARYMATVMTVVPQPSLDEFRAVPDDEISALGEEAAEMFDFDIAF